MTTHTDLPNELPIEEEVFALLKDGTAMTGFFQWEDYPNRKMKFYNDSGGYLDLDEIEKWVPIQEAIKKVFN